MANCNLGGGISQNLADELLEFKKSMSNQSSKFYIGYKVYDKIKYNKLLNEFKIKYPNNYLKHCKKILCYKYNDN